MSTNKKGSAAGHRPGRWRLQDARLASARWSGAQRRGRSESTLTGKIAVLSSAPMSFESAPTPAEPAGIIVTVVDRIPSGLRCSSTGITSNPGGEYQSVRGWLSIRTSVSETAANPNLMLESFNLIAAQLAIHVVYTTVTLADIHMALSN